MKFIAWFAPAMAAMALTGRAAEIYVAPGGSGGGTGWGDALATIGEGVAKATGGDTVLVSNGTYTLDAEIVVSAGITVRSWNDGKLDEVGTIVDGNFQTRCFKLTHPDAVLAGFTVRNGTNETAGGGVYVTGGGTVTQCVVSANSAREGGGVYVSTGLVTHSTLNENMAVSNAASTASRGGGVFLHRFGVVSNCLIAANTASNTHSGSDYGFSGGGGIGVHVATLGDECRVHGCVVSNNMSRSMGGGIIGQQLVAGVTPLVISGSTVADNRSSGHAGGVLVTAGSAHLLAGAITGCLIQGNSAGGEGGGLGARYNAMQVSRCVIRGNSSANGGGGCNLTICDSTVESNLTSNFGGGLYYYFCTYPHVVSDCVIRGNTAAIGANSGGGGIVFDNGRLTEVKCCEIRGNVSNKRASGVYVASAVTSTGHLYNCTICDNMTTNPTSDGMCGGAYAAYGPLQFSGCTIVSNRCAYASGVGGVYLSSASFMSNCIVYSNMAGSSYRRDIPYNVANVFYSCAPSNLPASQGNIADAPSFKDFANGDYRAAGDSSTVNAGTNESWMDGALDLAGHPRIDPFSRRADMGAYEFLPSGSLFRLR